MARRRKPKIHTAKQRAAHMAAYTAMARSGVDFGGELHMRVLDMEDKFLRQQRAGIDTYTDLDSVDK